VATNSCSGFVKNPDVTVSAVGIDSSFGLAAGYQVSKSIYRF
jgi:hypothetical protein